MDMGRGKHTKFFFALEKRNYTAKTMVILKRPDGTVVTEQKQILLKQMRFYEELYIKDKKVKFQLQNESGILIDQIQHEMLDALITVEEMTTAVYGMKMGKTPGLDGLLVEFWTVMPLNRGFM